MNENYHSKQWALIYDQFNQGRHQKELAFYRAELRQCAGPVLEVACGNGMIFLELLQEGFDIYCKTAKLGCQNFTKLGCHFSKKSEYRRKIFFSFGVKSGENAVGAGS